MNGLRVGGGVWIVLLLIYLGVALVGDGLGFVLRGGSGLVRGERGVFSEKAMGEGAEVGFAGEAVGGAVPMAAESVSIEML